MFVTEFLKTVAETVGKVLVNQADDAWFTPTETVEFVNHAAHPSIPVQNPAKVELVLGDPNKGMLDVAEVHELTLSYKAKFLSAGTHEIILAPNLTSDILIMSSGNLITSTFITNFEYRDDIILKFDVQDPNTSPTLSNPQISPSNTGTTTTNFVFNVQYYDKENDGPFPYLLLWTV